MEQLASLLLSSPVATPDLSTLVPFIMLGLLFGGLSFYLKGLVDPA